MEGAPADIGLRKEPEASRKVVRVGKVYGVPADPESNYGRFSALSDAEDDRVRQQQGVLVYLKRKDILLIEAENLTF